MFWPIVSPFGISVLLITILVTLLTIFSQPFKWSRKKTFLTSSIIGFIMVIPSCTGLMLIMDSYRFGIFTYQKYDEVQDFRIERFLPTSATNITLHKTSGSYQAKYQISEEDLLSYLNNMWDKYGEKSAVKREDFKSDGTTVLMKSWFRFKNLNWDLPDRATMYHSTRAGNGAGADYFYNHETQTVYQSSYYW